MVKMVLMPVWRFLVRYFLKLGFIDGWQGFVWTSLTAIYEFLKYAKAIELNKNKFQKRNVNDY